MAESDPAAPSEREEPTGSATDWPAAQFDAPRRRARGKLAVLVALTVVVIVLIGFGAVFGWRALQADSEEARRDAVLQTARVAADNLTTIDYHTADRDVQQLLDGSTPQFAQQFGIASPEFIEVVTGTQLVATGQVTSAAIERLDENSARVLVAVNGSVRDVNVPQGAPRKYRLGMEFV
ncbi:MAG: hypothetical protein LC799_09360, partial [Actinobacteria bacterium]|nr:hypothetical protein [Actinomycetota bacterium]